MANYTFIRTNGVAENLNDVDAKMCADLGEAVDANNYSAPYSITVEVGFAILMSMGGSRIDTGMVDAWLTKKREQGIPYGTFEEFEESIKTIRPYLDGTIYTFEAWR